LYVPRNSHWYSAHLSLSNDKEHCGLFARSSCDPRPIKTRLFYLWTVGCCSFGICLIDWVSRFWLESCAITFGGNNCFYEANFVWLTKHFFLSPLIDIYLRAPFGRSCRISNLLKGLFRLCLISNSCCPNFRIIMLHCFVSKWRR
jgi:hypothetical protein